MGEGRLRQIAFEVPLAADVTAPTVHGDRLLGHRSSADGGESPADAPCAGRNIRELSPVQFGTADHFALDDSDRFLLRIEAVFVQVVHDLRFKAAQAVQLFGKPCQHLRLESEPILRGFHKIAADENLTDFPWDRQFCGALHFKGRCGAGGTPCPPEQGTEGHSPASVLGKQTETSHRRVW